MTGTAVLIHGCHLDAKLNSGGWAKIVLGSGEIDQLHGRVPMGLKVAFEYEADCLVFGTGASSHEGVSEARCTYNAARGYLCGLPDQHQRRLERPMRDVVLLERVKNTREEVRDALQVCLGGKYGLLVLVSSPWHISRCHAEALNEVEILRQRGIDFVPEIVAVGCHGSTEEVVISEPPHRGDRPGVPIHLAVKRADRLGRNSTIAKDFHEAFTAFLNEWEAKVLPEK